MGGSEGPPGLRGSEGSPALGARRCRPAGGAAPAAPRPAGRGRCRAGAACSAHPSPSLPFPPSFPAPTFLCLFPFIFITVTLPSLFFLSFGGACRGCRLSPGVARVSRCPALPLVLLPVVSSVYPGVFLCSSPRHSALPLCSSLHEMELNNCTGADFSVPAICPCVEAPLLLWYFGCIRAANTRTITKLWISACAFLDHNEI